MDGFDKLSQRLAPYFGDNAPLGPIRFESPAHFTIGNGRVVVGGVKIATVEAGSPGAGRGLSGCHLPDDAGLLFKNGGAASYWMPGVPQALDLVFMRGDGMVLDVQKMAMVTDPAADLPLYSTTKVATHALELPEGWCARHGVSAGCYFKEQ